MEPPISFKTSRVLNIVLFTFFLILIRVWYLAVIQREAHVALSHRPQRRTRIERVERATIRDRFNIPMALNKTQYAAAVCYEDIRSIPSVRWVKEKGEKQKTYPRMTYIRQLAELLAKELDLDVQDIEDIIHAKASLFPHTSFILKEGISEALYYRLKFLETQWIGIRPERKSRRYYPLGKVGSDVVGYMGAINSKEYLRIAREINTLQSYLNARESGEMPILPKGFDNPLAVRERLKQLQEKAYTIHDVVGKTGVEASFEEELRGYSGKTIYEIDTKGNILRTLPGSRKAIPGQRVVLSISSELQTYAEQLLAQHEQFRELRHSDGTPSLTGPWIKGGAIVAMDVNTGEVLALASYPRFDPNDFVATADSSSPTLRWLENEAYVSEIWDGKRPLERERFDVRKQEFYDETLDLNWYRYLEAILPEKSTLYSTLRQIHNLSNAYHIQKHLEQLLTLSQQTSLKTLLAILYKDKEHRSFRNPIAREEIEKAEQALLQHPEAWLTAKQWIDPFLAPISHQDDQLLVIDLCRMVVNTDAFSPELLHAVGSHSLLHYRELSQITAQIQNELQGHLKSWFHKTDFLSWRQSHFKEFLSGKRKEEKEKKQYARPYTEYLEQLERASFKEFWQRYRGIFLDTFIFGKSSSLYTSMPALEPYLEKILTLREAKNAHSASADRLKTALSLLPPQLASQYLQSMRSFQELDRPLHGHYRHLRHTKGIQLEKHLAGAFYPLSGFGYGLSQAFRQWTPLGSVYKLVVAYQGMLEKYQAGASSFQDINPLTLIDDIQWTATPGSNQQVLGRFLNEQVIQRLYKGGRLPRGHPNIGKIDLIGAIEQSSNIYFSILAVDHIENPWNLIEVSRLFGFGERSGIELPGEVSGLLPDDISHNRTGLYSMAIGQHSLVVTPLQTAVMLSAIANNGHVLTPKITQLIAGNQPLYAYQDPFETSSYPYEEALHLIGIHFPLFTATQVEKTTSQVWGCSPEIKRSLPFPEVLRDPLIEGMYRVINGVKGTARPHIIRFLNQHPQMKKNFQDLKGQIIGKTGTAEILYKQTIDAESAAEIHNHIWFGGISLLPSSQLTKLQSMEPELAIVIYLRLSDSGGKEAAPLATEIIKKWREICEKQGRRAFIEAS